MRCEDCRRVSRKRGESANSGTHLNSARRFSASSLRFFPVVRSISALEMARSISGNLLLSSVRSLSTFCLPSAKTRNASTATCCSCSHLATSSGDTSSATILELILPFAGRPPPPDIVPETSMSCPSSVTTLQRLLPAPNARRLPWSRSIATSVLVRSWKKAGANLGSLTVMRSKRRGAFSGVWTGLMSRAAIRSRHMTLARPRSFLRRCSMQACPTEIVSVTRLSSPPQAVEMATSYLSSIRPRFPSRPCAYDESAIATFGGERGRTHVESCEATLLLELRQAREDVALRSTSRVRRLGFV